MIPEMIFNYQGLQFFTKVKHRLRRSSIGARSLDW